MENTKHMPSPEIELLWDYLKRDPEHKDRRQTGWGTKTQAGLSACISRINRESAEYRELLEACEAAVEAYQQMFDVMPVAWQTVDNILNGAIAKAKAVN